MPSVLIYDGDCPFCTRSARLLARMAPGPAVRPWQSADLDALGLTATQAAGAVQWVAADGTIRSGHAAIAAMLAAAGRSRLWRLAGRLMLVPGISQLAARVYRLVAANRHRLS